MEEQLRALGVLTILSSKKRREVQRLREQLHRTVSTVDTFYALLGERHWVFHENLDLDRMVTLTTVSNGDADKAERGLIDYYHEEGNLPSLALRLTALRGMRQR